MRDLHDLRQTLVDHEVLAPDSADLVQAAQQGAERIRRRRRMAYTAGAAVATAAIVALAPAVVAHLSHPPGSTATRPSYRGPLQVTVHLAGDSGYYTLEYSVIGNSQLLVARSSDASSAHSGATVVVHDPDTFDGTRLLRGEPIAVRGHRAYFVADLPLGSAPNALPRPDKPNKPGKSEPVSVSGPAVGWQDASGAWVVIYNAAGGSAGGQRVELARVAEAVRLGKPRDVLTPYQLGYVPGGLPATYALVRDNLPNEATSVVGLGGQPKLDGPFGRQTSDDQPLEIEVMPRDAYVDSHIAEYGGKAAKIAGHESWYVTETRGVVVPDGGSVLIVNVGHCWVSIQAMDRKQIPYEELKKLVESAEFKDCADPRTWTRPVP
jgi:hypothetical protein